MFCIYGDDKLLNLTDITFFKSKIDIFDQLLGHGAAPGLNASGMKIHVDSISDLHGGISGMLEESIIFDPEDEMNQFKGHPGQGDKICVLTSVFIEFLQRPLIQQDHNVDDNEKACDQEGRQGDQDNK